MQVSNRVAHWWTFRPAIQSDKEKIGSCPFALLPEDSAVISDLADNRDVRMVGDCRDCDLAH
jgi:hypothetical protein